MSTSIACVHRLLKSCQHRSVHWIMPRTRVRIVDMSAKSQDPISTALSSYSTYDISDALLKLGIPTGGFPPGISLWSPQRQEGPTRVAGPAYTVKFVRNHQTNAPVLAKHYVRTESPQYRFWLMLIRYFRLTQYLLDLSSSSRRLRTSQMRSMVV
jgi:hypothetical protein